MGNGSLVEQDWLDFKWSWGWIWNSGVGVGIEISRVGIGVGVGVDILEICRSWNWSWSWNLRSWSWNSGDWPELELESLELELISWSWPQPWEWESLKCWDLVHLILEIWRYVIYIFSHWHLVYFVRYCPQMNVLGLISDHMDQTLTKGLRCPNNSTCPACKIGLLSKQIIQNLVEKLAKIFYLAN